MRRLDYESAHYGEIPTTGQLSSLAAQILLFANRHGRLNIDDNYDEGVKRYRIGRMSHYECPGILDGSPFGYLTEESLSAYAKYRRDSGEWKLRVFDRFDTIELGSQRGCSRTSYSFDWDNDGVTKSRRKVAVIPDQHPEELIDVVDQLVMPEDVVWIPEMEISSEYLGPEDVEYLSRQLGRRMVGVDFEERDYTEKRLNYMDYFAK